MSAPTIGPQTPAPGTRSPSILDQVPVWAVITAGVAVTVGVAGIAYAVAKSGDSNTSYGQLGDGASFGEDDDLERRKAQIRRRMAELSRKYG